MRLLCSLCSVGCQYGLCFFSNPTADAVCCLHVSRLSHSLRSELPELPCATLKYRK